LAGEVRPDTGTLLAPAAQSSMSGLENGLLLKLPFRARSGMSVCEVELFVC
jgi:hypothetical protein